MKLGLYSLSLCFVSFGNCFVFDCICDHSKENGRQCFLVLKADEKKTDRMAFLSGVFCIFQRVRDNTRNFQHSQVFPQHLTLPANCFSK